MLTKTFSIALAAASLALAAPARAQAPLLDVRDCLLTLHAFADRPARLQPQFVPAHYRPLAFVPGLPYIAVWSARCERMAVGGGAAAPGHLTIAAVALRHPDGAAVQNPVELPNTWAHYVHAVMTDRPELARALSHAGFPAKHVPAMGMTRRVVAGAGLPAPLRPLAEHRAFAAGELASWTRPPVQHEPAHAHRNTFIRDAGETTNVLELRIPTAVDHFCELSVASLCGEVSAPAGSAVAALLGRSTRAADASVGHDPIARGVAFTTTARYPR